MKIASATEAALTDALARTRPVSSIDHIVGGSTNATKVEAIAEVDAVSLSQTSLQLAAEGREKEPIRAEKVAEVRRAIDEGLFTVDAEAVAGKMIAEATELLSAQRHKP